MTVASRDSRPTARRLRVLVMGSSVGFYVRPPATGPDASFAGRLEERLAELGVLAEVRNASRWFETLPDGFRRLPELLTWHRPHVVVLAYGYIESQPMVWPRWLSTWLFSWRPGTGLPSRLLRGLLDPPGRRVALWAAPRLARIPRLPSRLGPRRVRAELDRFLDLLDKECGAVVVCLTTPEVSDRVEQVFPTTRARIRATNRAIVDAVGDSGHGDRIVVDVHHLVVEHGHEQLAPDGIHLSAQGHDLVADAVLDRLGGSRALAGLGR